jgi:hypothetical protein
MINVRLSGFSKQNHARPTDKPTPYLPRFIHAISGINGTPHAVPATK